MKLEAIVDSVGRVILGRHDEEASTDSTMNLRNPAVVNIQVNQQSGQISVQLIPFIFREFVRSDLQEAGASWNFQKCNIVVSDDLALAENIEEQYVKIFETAPLEPGEVTPEAPAAKLFDEAEVVEDAVVDETADAAK